MSDVDEMTFGYLVDVNWQNFYNLLKHWGMMSLPLSRTSSLPWEMVIKSEQVASDVIISTQIDTRTNCHGENK